MKIENMLTCIFNDIIKQNLNQAIFRLFLSLLIRRLSLQLSASAIRVGNLGSWYRSGNPFFGVGLSSSCWFSSVCFGVMGAGTTKLSGGATSSFSLLLKHKYFVVSL